MKKLLIAGLILLLFSCNVPPTLRLNDKRYERRELVRNGLSEALVEQSDLFTLKENNVATITSNGGEVLIFQKRQAASSELRYYLLD